jgi:nucleoid DNA-binding protein
MEELAKLIAQEFGLEEEKANEVVTTVAESLKAKLPPLLAGQIDGLLAGRKA